MTEARAEAGWRRRKRNCGGGSASQRHARPDRRRSLDRVHKSDDQAFRQREAATAFLAAATRSFERRPESYTYGVRNLLDVTAAQKVLAQARSTDVLARTQVLSALADLAFRAGDSIQAKSRKTRP